MKFTVDRCLSCGSPTRGRFNPCVDIVNPDGTILSSPYWFCSNKCVETEVNRLIEDKRFQLGRTAYDDKKNIPDHYIEEWLETWKEQQAASISGACVALVKRIAGEYQVYVQKINAEADREVHKRTEREQLQQQKEFEQREKFITEAALELIRQEDEEKALLELLRFRDIPQKLRFEHTHILGPTGSGKTTLIQDIFIGDIWDNKNKKLKDPPAYIIIDPKGTLIDRIGHLELFHSTFRDRLVIIDPVDRPALNVFQAQGNNPEQISSLFSYIFSTTKQSFTGRQETCFAFCISLLFRVPQADLFTLLDLLDDATDRIQTRDPRFAAAIATITDRAARRFFEVDYYSQTYTSTRQEIKTRIWQVLRNEYLSAMFNSPERKVDLSECIRKRKVVLVNTRMLQLKGAHQTLGRYILALAVDAIQARPLGSHPAYIVIDEFQEFADAEKIPEMLHLIREYNGGAVLAHHNMFCQEFNETGHADAIRSAISTNTTIKFASAPAALDRLHGSRYALQG